MKTALILLAVLALGALGFTIVYRHDQPTTTTTVFVLRDLTESFIAQPEVGELFELFDLSAAGKWNGAQLYYSSVTDVSFNRVSEAKLSAANKWLSNELEREKDVKRFHSDLSKIVGNSASDTVGRSHSSVYLAIAQQLERLSESNADKKVLIVYSDLMENTPEDSFYDDRVLAVLRERPEKIVQAWEGRRGLPSLAGITVYLIYQPKNATDDAVYQTVSGFYRTLLESKGATVHVAANLSNH